MHGLTLESEIKKAIRQGCGLARTIRVLRQCRLNKLHWKIEPDGQISDKWSKI